AQRVPAHAGTPEEPGEEVEKAERENAEMTADPWADSIPAHKEDPVTDTHEDHEEESATFAAFKVKGTGREHEDIVQREKNLPPANVMVPVTIVDATVNESKVPWHDGEQAL